MFLFRFGSVTVLFGLIMSQSVRAETALNADQIIGKAIARGQQPAPGPATLGFTYTKVSITEEFDSSGRMREHKKKVYQVSVRDGASSARLVEVNGHPPAEVDLKKQAQNELNLRQIVGDAKTANTGAQDNFLTPEVAARFDFSLASDEPLNGRRTYVINFRPKNPPPASHRMVDRLLDSLSGRLWIDADEFEVAKAEVRLGSQVDLLGGLIGSLRKLAYTMTRTRVANGVWLSSFSSGDFEGRKLLDSLHIKTHTETSNFQPVS